MTTVLEAALELSAERGLPLVPCNAEKRPLLADWTNKELRSLEQIQAAFSRPGVELIGVRTGSVSGLLVIDIDLQSGGDAWYRENSQRLECGRIHRTRAGGWHLIYKMPASVVIRNSVSTLAMGVDVRADGGQIIWWPAHGLPVAMDDEPGPPPTWLLEALTAKPNGHAHGGHQKDGQSLRDGGRNAGLTSLAGKLRRDGLSAGELVAALLAANRERCRPPLPDPEVVKIARSVASYPGGVSEPAPVAFGEIIIPSLAELVRTKVLPRTWFFETILPAGAFLYVGRPKIGKSWFLMQLALAYARGDSFLGYSCLESGGVLYVAAEDDATRMKERFTLTGQMIPPANLHVLVGEQFRALADQYSGTMRLVDFFDGYLREHPDVRMILGDTEATMRAIWDGASKGQDIKAKDYGETREFDRLALEHRAFVLLVNHTAKRRNGGYLDLHELINRTNVALAGCSGSLVMADPPNREVGDDEDKVRLLGIRGRDLRDDILLAVEQEETGMFRSLGPWTAFATTAAEHEILEVTLEMHKESPDAWLKSKAIADTIGKQAGTVQRTISRMLKAGRNTWQGYRIETKASKGLKLVSMYGERL